MRSRHTLLAAALVALASIAPLAAQQVDQLVDPRNQSPACGTAAPELAWNSTDRQWHCTDTRVITKTVANIANGVATALLTVRVPNAAVGAVLHVRIMGSLGTGGSVNPFECSASLDGNVGVARTAGTLAVVNASTAAETSNACVAAGVGITLAYSASSVSGGTGGVDTFTVRATISAGNGNSLAKHQAMVYAVLKQNGNAAGQVSVQ